MKKKIIRIKDVTQIDTKKISVYDLNNRYIDPLGNMFGLKYNRLNKKVEIVKLQRIHNSELHSMQKKIHENKNVKPQNDESQNDVKTTTSSETENESLFFNPDIFIESIIKNIDTHKERIRGIDMNIEESNIFPKEKKMESTEVDAILKNLDIEGIQQIEKIEGYYRELTSFPRSLTYYQAKIDREGKVIFDQLSGNKEKTMRFVFLYEIEQTIRRSYSNLKKHLINLDNMIKVKDVDDIHGVTKHMKQSYNDALVSIKNTISEIDEIMSKADQLKDYSMDLRNY